LERIEPKAGECYFLPAGIAHALGPGLLVAEIQQSSDTTYRLFDWNRLGADGKPRQLHIEQSLEAIDFVAGPVAAQRPQPTEQPHVERLVACDKFVLDRWNVAKAEAIGGDRRAHILAVLAGKVEIAGDPAEQPLERGGVIFLPASLGPVTLTPHADVVLLDMYLP
jgi:mannose-6-phosphate isomerase